MPTASDVLAAHARLRRYLDVTPTHYAERFGCWLKLENLQRTGSYKVRGAMNALLAMRERDDVRTVMARSLETGLVRPSRDEEARLRYLTYVTMGAVLVQYVTSPDRTPDEFVASLRESRKDQILPTLELFTEGLFADRTMLDDYVRYLWQPPDTAADPDDQTA